MKGNEFRISWNRREGRTMRRQDSKASGGQVRTEQHRADVHRKPAEARQDG